MVCPRSRVRNELEGAGVEIAVHSMVISLIIAPSRMCSQLGNRGQITAVYPGTTIWYLLQHQI